MQRYRIPQMELPVPRWEARRLQDKFSQCEGHFGQGHCAGYVSLNQEDAARNISSGAISARVQE